MIIATYIQVKFQLEGTHCFPNADGVYSILKFPHRHLFHFRIKIEVQHDEREIEFLAFRKELIDEVSGLAPFQGKDSTLSCEAIARCIIGYISSKYPRNMQCEVSEDGENSAILDYMA